VTAKTSRHAAVPANSGAAPASTIPFKIGAEACAGATRLANNGATVAQLEALFAWEGGNMAALYTKTADRGRLSRVAVGMLAKPKTATSKLLPFENRLLPDKNPNKINARSKIWCGQEDSNLHPG
jgi:hypothetical protein